MIITKGCSVFPILRITTKIIPRKIAERITKNKPKNSTSVPKPLIISTPKKAIKNNNHCMGFIFSFRKKSAKTAANIGAVYLKETAVPILK